MRRANGVTGGILGGVLAIAIAGAGAPACAEDEDQEGRTVPLAAALEAVQAEAGFQAPAWRTMQEARTVFRRLLAGEAEPDAAALEPFGLVARTVRIGTGRVHAISDPPAEVRGRGFYLLNQGVSDASDVLLQAPHRFKDLDTGEIATELVAAGGFRAAAWNTVPRWAPDDRSDRSSDVAHLDVSLFNAFTLAFAEAYPDGAVVQLHGYARGHRDTSAGRRAEVIVSSGTRRLQGPARAVYRCLDSALDAVVLGYGESVFELGATTNRNAAALRRIGFRRFVHVEMVRELRRRVLEEPALQARLRRCLLEAAP